VFGIGLPITFTARSVAGKATTRVSNLAAISAEALRLLTSIAPPGLSPLVSVGSSSRVSSWTMRKSGLRTWLLSVIGFSSIRTKAITGAPRRSAPKAGKAWQVNPASKAAAARR